MIAFKLAFRNLWGAGLRTWLNVSVLSVAFIITIFYNGLLDGWNLEAYRETKAWDVGGGKIWHKNYDPYDPYCLVDAHDSITPEFHAEITKNNIVPILITQATTYPQSGHMVNLLLKGIDKNQKILKIPTEKFHYNAAEIPALIGKRMATQMKVNKNDRILVRWRDKNGTFDAKEIEIVDIFDSDVATIDAAQIWIPLDVLQEMTGLKNHATLFVVKEGYQPAIPNDTWQFKDENFLLKEIDEMIKAKRGSSAVIYIILFAIALLAIFDTQVLSIFKRQKEIGTYIAMGMTRGRVIGIFTIEGSMHSIFAIILGSIYGIPLLGWISKVGIPLPPMAESAGITIGERLIPYFSIGLIMSTVILVIISATIVSYFPTRKIAKMSPTDALKGKLQ